MGGITATTRGEDLSGVVGRWTYIAGIMYFDGGPVERVPFFWYHLCLTVSYEPGKEAVRYLKTIESGMAWKLL